MASIGNLSEMVNEAHELHQQVQSVPRLCASLADINNIDAHAIIVWIHQRIAFASGCASIDLTAFSTITLGVESPTFIKITAHIYWFGS